MRIKINVRPYVKRGRQRGWEVDLRVLRANGEHIRERLQAPVSSKSGARRWGEERVAFLLEHGKHERAAARELPSFAQFVDERWLPVYPASVGNRPSTIEEKQRHVRLYLKPALGDLRLDSVTPEAISKLLASMKRKRLPEEMLSPKTIKNVRATLRTILASAVEWGLLPSIPSMRKVKVPEVEFDCFTASEAAQLVAGARNDDERAILLFALRTGARAGEQLALEWGDIDWPNRKVCFRRSRTGKHIGPPKSGKFRKVPLSESLLVALRRVQHLKGPLVFCRANGQTRTLWQLHEILWGACRRAGLRKIRWHDLRHSFASQLVQANVPLRQVQDWLGHSTITMTMRYAHLSPGAGDSLIGALDLGEIRETRAVEKKAGEVSAG
jgi:integrase